MRPRKLDAEFFDRPPTEVAPDLIGRTLIRKHYGSRVAGVITETGAYSGHEGKVTKNRRGLYYPAGHIYVQSFRGQNFLNIGTGQKDGPSVVCIRKVFPTEGIPEIEKRRGKLPIKDEQILYLLGLEKIQAISQDTVTKLKNLTDGPGKVAEAFGVDKNFDRTPLGKRLWIEGERAGYVTEIVPTDVSDNCLGCYSAIFL